MKIKRMLAILDRPIGIAVLAGVLAGGLSHLILLHGINLSADGWAYWEGSVSLLAGRGYTYFGGQAITFFPPLFSAYLAAVQGLIGISGLSLTVGVIILASLTTTLWTYLIISCSNHRKETRWVKWLVALYFATAVPYWYRSLLSETLALCLLGLALVILCRLRNEEANPDAPFPLRILVGLTTVIAVALLTKNAYLTFVPGLAFAVAHCRPRAGRKHRIMATVTCLSAPTMAWLAVRGLLGQHQSHLPGLGAGKYTPLDYAQQLGSGTAELIAYDGLGCISWLMTFLLLTSFCKCVFHLSPDSNGRRANVRSIATVGIVGTLGLYIIFNVTWITDNLEGRFLWHIPLIVVGTLTAGLTWLPICRWGRFVSILLLAVATIQFGRTGKLVYATVSGARTPNVSGAMTITHGYVEGPAKPTGSMTLVPPPTFRHIDRTPGSR